jgi:hypothetical protein
MLEDGLGSPALACFPAWNLFGDREEMLEDGHGSLALVSLPGILFGDREEMLEDGLGSLALVCLLESSLGTGKRCLRMDMVLWL